LQAADVGKGTKLLDAGCGAGGACFLAAHYGAEAFGFDQSAALIKLARQRLPQGHFEIADLASPPFGDERFDVIMTANALQFAADPASVLRAWLSRLTPGRGTIVVGLWSPQEESEQYRIMRAVRGVLPRPPAGGNPFALSAPGQLEALLQSVGLTLGPAREVELTFEYPDMETCWRALRSTGSMQSAIQIGGEDVVKPALVETARQFLMTDGSVFIHNKMRYVLGRNF
jgi:SAM-dependent methyltransferase